MDLQRAMVCFSRWKLKTQTR
ncbi:BnaC01g19820D [Brassica napus]|uniref:BnaC01g19820D protein n=1 Tax=Brassica napus TaxID=3708 RepID=A0A078HPS8_BRANA|nr:BnaC01g19820D [Brassica napus]